MEGGGDRVERNPLPANPTHLDSGGEKATADLIVCEELAEKKKAPYWWGCSYAWQNAGRRHSLCGYGAQRPGRKGLCISCLLTCLVLSYLYSLSFLSYAFEHADPHFKSAFQVQWSRQSQSRDTRSLSGRQPCRALSQQQGEMQRAGVCDKHHCVLLLPLRREVSLVAIRRWQDYLHLSAECSANTLRVSPFCPSLSHHKHPLLELSHTTQHLKLYLL